jgi:Zn-finger nucleic acid-binding protein
VHPSCLKMEIFSEFLCPKCSVKLKLKSREIHTQDWFHICNKCGSHEITFNQEGDFACLKCEEPIKTLKKFALEEYVCPRCKTSYFGMDEIIDIPQVTTSLNFTEEDMKEMTYKIPDFDGPSRRVFYC